jgi:hypothetical protein
VTHASTASASLAVVHLCDALESYSRNWAERLIFVCPLSHVPNVFLFGYGCLQCSALIPFVWVSVLAHLGHVFLSMSEGCAGRKFAFVIYAARKEWREVLWLCYAWPVCST